MKVLLLLFLTVPFVAQGQLDSTRIQTEIGLRGRRQTGTLEQLSINPNARFILASSSFELDAGANYQLLKVGDIKVVNDLWTNVLARVNTSKRIFPLAIAYYGYADSYRIDKSIVSGAGLGINLIKHSPSKYLQMHLFGGGSEVEFEEGLSMSSSILGSFIRAEFPLDKEKLSIRWEFHSYHSMKNSNFNGSNNLLQINYRLFKGFHLKYKSFDHLQ